MSDLNSDLDPDSESESESVIEQEDPLLLVYLRDLDGMDQQLNKIFSDSNVPEVVGSIDPSSTGTARPETRFVWSTRSDRLFVESRATAAADIAKARDRKCILRN